MSQIPTPCRIVLYHHPVDHQDYPALITEVTGGPQPDTKLSGSDEVLPGEILPYVCYLTIFRPRAIDWRRCSEGEGDGCWSWPEHDEGWIRDIEAAHEFLHADPREEAH